MQFLPASSLSLSLAGIRFDTIADVIALQDPAREAGERRHADRAYRRFT